MLCQTSDLQMCELRKESFVKLISAWLICHVIVNDYIMGQKFCTISDFCEQFVYKLILQTS